MLMKFPFYRVLLKTLTYKEKLINNNPLPETFYIKFF